MVLRDVVAAATMVDRHPVLGANLIDGQMPDQTFLELARRRRVIGPNPGVGAVHEAARSGDQVASELVAERGRLIARAVAVIDAAVNPAAVVFAGLEDAMVLPEEGARSKQKTPLALRPAGFKCSATTYSPTASPQQYHRRWRA